MRLGFILLLPILAQTVQHCPDSRYCYTANSGEQVCDGDYKSGKPTDQSQEPAEPKHVNPEPNGEFGRSVYPPGVDPYNPNTPPVPLDANGVPIVQNSPIVPANEK